MDNSRTHRQSLAILIFCLHLLPCFQVKNSLICNEHRLQLHGAIYRSDCFVLMLRYCANLKAIRYESKSLNRIVAGKSYCGYTLLFMMNNLDNNRKKVNCFVLSISKQISKTYFGKSNHPL